MSKQDDLKLTLLAMLSPSRQLSQAEIDGLSDVDWNVIQAMARQHRLEPLLWWQLTRADPSLVVPEHIQLAWHGAYRAASMQALEVQRALILLHRILEQRAITYAALKGSFLAFFAYPQPGLRPLRDIDLLVAKERAQEAFAALLANGGSRAPHAHGDPCAMLESAHQLPPLLFDNDSIVVEIHFQLLHSYSLDDRRLDPSTAPRFWQRTSSRPIAGCDIHFLDVTDLLHHLVVHAVYGHFLDNGPLTLSDIAFLTQREAIDWPRFWALARQSRHTRGAALLLRLVEYYWGEQPAIWTDAQALQVPVSESLLRTAACLTLRDLDCKGYIGLRSELRQDRSVPERLALWWHRAFPARTAIASLYSVSHRSWRVFLYYPVKWLRLFTVRLPETARHFRSQQVEAQVDALVSMKAWLDDLGA